jgi:hypothetical protein
LQDVSDSVGNSWPMSIGGAPAQAVSPPVVQWRQVGADPLVVEIRANRRVLLRRPDVQLSTALLLFALFGFFHAWSRVTRVFEDGGNDAAYLGALAAVVPLVLALRWRLNRMLVRIDPGGVTVTNFWATHRVDWADVDTFAFGARDAVTLLTRDREIACTALRCPSWDSLKLGHERRREIRRELDAARAWLAATTLRPTPH